MTTKGTNDTKGEGKRVKITSKIKAIEIEWEGDRPPAEIFQEVGKLLAAAFPLPKPEEDPDARPDV